MKTIFKNGNVIDGTGSEGRIADVMVDEGRIVAIGQIEVGVNEQVIDATGKIICPGFIDTHTHSDLSAIINPALSAKIRQGITTELLGQDGVALAPLPVRKQSGFCYVQHCVMVKCLHRWCGEM